MRRKKNKKIVGRTDTSSKAKKVAKKKKPRKGAAPKTRNAKTMTEQGFWNMVRQLLRRRTVFWQPILNVRNRARIPYKGPNKRRKYSYICENCSGEFPATHINVHHKIPAGSLTCKEDAGGFIDRLFCEEENLQLLCQNCHSKQHE